MLVEAYEQVRNSVTGTNGGGILRGLAILMREGMAAWIHAVAALPPAAVSLPEAAARGAAAALALVPTGVQREVIEVLTTMALTSELEVRA